jgi:hypothetical protein
MKRFWPAVLLTTLVAGTLDITYAHVEQTINTGHFPSKMFYAIAGGAIGLERAFAGGVGILLLGIFIHYFISFAFTLFYFLTAPFLRRWSKNKYLNGFFCAIFAQVVMTFLVMPLTAFPYKPFVFSMDVLKGLLAFTLIFGLPIALMEAWYRKRTLQD